MRKNRISTTLIACIFIMILCFAVPVNAASVKKYNYLKKNTTIKQDMTHDGKADTINIKLTKDDYYIQKVAIEINGTKVYSTSDVWSYNLNVQYFKYTNKDEFLYLCGKGDSERPYIQKILYYNTSKKKLEIALDLYKYTGAAISISVPSKNNLKVGYECGPGTVGRIHWDFTYTYSPKTHTFKLKKSTAAVKTAFPFDPKDGLTSSFKKNKYKVAKTVQFYSDKACKKRSFTVTPGKWVVLKNVYVTKDGAMSVSFTYGKKTGWIKVRDPKNHFVSGVYFEGVSRRLAGGFYG